MVNSGRILPIILLASAIPALAQSPGTVERVEECFAKPPDGVAPNAGVDCGYVAVPQSRSGGPDGTIQLAFMRIRGAEKTGAPPLFILGGGPGQSVIADDMLLLFQEPFIGSVLARHDVVLLEQRGTLHSRPALLCPEADASGLAALKEGAGATLSDELLVAALAECAARHRAEGVDLASYTTAENASDVNDARAALGYERIVFYGGSYGSLLGLFVLRQHPEALAGVILDGTETPTTPSWTSERGLNAQWGLDNLTRLCAADPACASRFDIPALVEELFATFGEEPVAVPVTLPDDDESHTLTVTREDLAEYVYSLQTNKYGVPAMPAELMQLIEGGRDTIAEMLAQATVSEAVASASDGGGGMLTLMHAAMVCSDDPAREGEAVETQDMGTYAKVFAALAEREYVALCNVIDVPQLPESSDAPVRSDVPVLVLSGGLDVQTPYFHGDAVAESLGNVANVVFPAGFHVQVASLNRCAMTIMTAFVADPGSPLDTSCADDERPLPFLTPEALREAMSEAGQ